MKNVSVILCLLLISNIAKSQIAVTCDSTFEIRTKEKEIIPIEVPSGIFYHNIWDNTNIKYNIDKSLTHNDTLVVSIDSTDKFTYPMTTIGRFLSKFGPRHGRMHTGTDIKLNLNDTVMAVFAGRVRIAKRVSGYGNMVLIRHSNGLETLYGHLNKILVKVNDDVKSGDLIGLGGRTGRATTEHLHFETRILGIPFNCEKYINFSTGELTFNKLYFLNNQIEISPDNFENYQVPQNDSDLEAGFDSEVGQQTLIVTVKKGDTINKIAKKYNTTIESILKINKLKKTSTLSIGQQIRIK